LDRYTALQPKFIQGHLGVARSLGSGESLISFDNTTGSTNTVRREGGKIALAAPASDRMPMFFTSEAILKDAPHSNAAKLYVSWFLSKEQQSRIGVYSSRSDVPPQPVSCLCRLEAREHRLTPIELPAIMPIPAQFGRQLNRDIKHEIDVRFFAASVVLFFEQAVTQVAKQIRRIATNREIVASPFRLVGNGPDAAAVLIEQGGACHDVLLDLASNNGAACGELRQSLGRSERIVVEKDHVPARRQSCGGDGRLVCFVGFACVDEP
jgi:hypothetical protein